MATPQDQRTNLLALTDCLYFTNGSCTFKGKCRYRHCQAAIKQFERCPNWPHSCRDVNCPFRHTKTRSTEVKSVSKQEGLVVFFWDIENVPIPKGQKPFDIVQRIRQKLVIEPGLQEVDFSCYCNITTISLENQQSLQHATVRLIHVPDRKPGAADRQIMLDLSRFERSHRPPATIVLISGDIDFVGTLSDLRHQARFHVIVIHNKPAKDELKATVNEHYPWEFFTGSPAPTPSPPQSLMRPYIRDFSERTTQSPANSRPALNDERKPNKSKPPHIRSLLDVPIENILPQTNQPERKPSISHQHSERVTINRHSPNHTPTLKSPILPSSNETSISNDDKSASSTVSASTAVPRFRMRHATSIDQIIKPKVSISASCEEISSTVDDTTKKIPPTMYQCPYCTNEFNMIAALRQHQKDKSHLFDCPICKAGYPTAMALKQHQTAKGHGVTTDPDDHCDDAIIPEEINNIN
jgi:hypothetical protein